ncbi:hypothetical protein CSKR_202107 [Clonorchis sinensis]|uniref:PWWP domain-containing protein n=1 Tax=Clonorchis sinensis TaxID=79923 RepID=A0A8T1LW45_CLOSI|nr:hypothetical protein CSKR_202107 [Clonorchis sinensis]
MTYRPGDKVFAKIKGFSNWPARVNPLPPDVQIPKGKLPVFFYGTYQVSFVPVKNIVPYEKFKEKLGKPKSSPQFMTAMQEIESNPGIYMLGEDPRAERFLLQFYQFQPGSTSAPRRNHAVSARGAERPKSSKIPPPDTPDSLSSLSEPDDPQTKVLSPVRGRGRTKPVGQQRSAPKIVPASKPEPSSETSSDASSALSKLERNPTSDDDDDDTNETLTKHSSVDVSTQGDPLSDVDAGSLEADLARYPSASQTEAVEESVPTDSHEARKLQRKLEKKAQKKAAKKAAKREAKRLAKEAERAERRARREARREMKRLHRLEKLQRMQELSAGGVIEMVGESFQSRDTWNFNSEQLSPPHNHPYMTEEVQAVGMPYEELIAAELECTDVLSPNLDRPTSPLRLDDYLQAELPNDSGVDDSLNDTTLMMKEEDVAFSLVPSGSPPASNTSPAAANNKRSLQRSSEEDSPALSLDSEPEQVLLPRKRAKPEPKRPASSLPSPLNDQSSEIETIDKSTSVVATKWEKQPYPSTTENKSKRDRSTSGKSRTVVKSRKNAAARRRRIVDSSSSDENEHEGSPNHDSEPAIASPDSPAAPHHRKDAQQLSSTKIPIKSEMVQHRKSSPTEIPRKPQHGEDAGSRKHSKASESRPPADEKKKHRTPEDGHPTGSPGPADVVTQLCQHCRELKASLIRGHENFAVAVQHLTQLATIQARLPQLAQVWDLMDCIKKCRRYKLSEEVRNAAQKTFSAFQSIKSSATKEELAETQVLIAAHQNRPTTTASGGNASSDFNSNQSKLSGDGHPTAHVDPPKTTPENVVSTCVSSPVSTAVGTATTTSTANSQTHLPESPTATKVEPENLTADLEAKMDDMLSRIRATEERMAAAAAAAQSHSKPVSKLPHGIVPATYLHQELGSNIPSSGLVYGGAGHVIRAKAVAAAAAHMHDEEDEESVMSRVEQVAAYEEASKATSGVLGPTTANTHVHRSPPPPPPPPPFPSTSLRVSTGTTNSTPLSTRTTSPPSVDLDLDSRIERLITGPKPSQTRSPVVVSNPNTRFTESSSKQIAAGPLPAGDGNNGHPTIPAPLLAVADKIAAVRALNPSPKKRDLIRKSPRSSLAQADAGAKQLQADQHASQDDELYDLLGV